MIHNIIYRILTTFLNFLHKMHKLIKFCFEDMIENDNWGTMTKFTLWNMVSSVGNNRSTDQQ